MNNKKSIYIEETLKNISIKNATFDAKEEIRSNIMEYINKDQKSIKSYRLTIFYYLMGIVIMMGIVSCIYISQNVNIIGIGNNTYIKLPNSSEVQLKENAQIKYNRIKWLFKKEILLSGSADFIVGKGKEMAITTPLGNISALSTMFFVNQTANILEVECCSGTIIVKTEAGQSVLLKDEEMIYYKDSNIIKTFNQ